MMTSVLAWYQGALKETQKAYRKHRKFCTVRDKPIYKDVKDSGGLSKKYEVNLSKKVEMLDEKLTEIQDKVKLLKEAISRRKISDIPGKSNAIPNT
ncbi:hypothetical protein CARUB_v10024405mg [Capsella rubella]|uniref:Uncharacterized protein n=1 Tax=Capsella rubella TaxID=81985 RepID=R0FZG6_9BRAS|nr:hypothetical protein CARUB_v10024405mg [Capsella rubella]